MTNERKTCTAYAVKDGDKITFIHVEKGPAQAIAAHTATAPNRRLIEIWIKEKAET